LSDNQDQIPTKKKKKKKTEHFNWWKKLNDDAGIAFVGYSGSRLMLWLWDLGN
jgi:hypothetical protein